jgi:hypothetical protein
VFANVEEAPLRREKAGVVPAGDGWFIVNIADSQGVHTERFGDACVFEGRIGTFPELGSTFACSSPGSRPRCITARMLKRRSWS